MLSIVFPFIDISNPLLTIRMAESLIGRLTTYKLTVVTPAHFLGCIVGTVSFRTILPFVPTSVVQPVVLSSEMDLMSSIAMEILFVTLYVFFYLVVPDLLEVNKHSRYLVIVLMLPLLLLGRGKSVINLTVA